MTRQKDRDEFISVLTRELPDKPPHIVAELARKLMRAATTLHRLAEAQCNGDYPCDNGQRKVMWCPNCDGGYVREVMKTCTALETAENIAACAPRFRPVFCPDCRTTERVKALCKSYGLKAITQGDPRGAVLKVVVPSGYTNDWGREGVCVP